MRPYKRDVLEIKHIIIIFTKTLTILMITLETFNDLIFLGGDVCEYV